VVVALIAILATIALDRLWALRVDAERVAMAQMLGTLRSALGMKVAEYLARGDLTGLRQLEGSNPVELLAEIPENYRGAWPGPEPGSIPGGSWYFDSTNGTLVYRVYHAEEFHSPLPGPPRARFRVEVLYGLHGEPQGARLAALEPYRWGPSAVPKGDENLSTAEKRQP
jgi:general secretion pathway protein G